MFDSFELFKVYCAVKAHFNSNYDYWKSSGQVKCKIESFERRNDKKLFDLLFKKYRNRPSSFWFFVSNFLIDSNQHVSKLIDSDSDDIFADWQNRIKQIKDFYQRDLKFLKENCKGNDIFFSDKYYPPYIIQSLYLFKINIESVLLLNKFFNIFYKFDLEYGDIMIYSDLRNKIIKYESILRLSDSKLQECRELTL